MIQRIVNPLIASIVEDIISKFDGAEVGTIFLSTGSASPSVFDPSITTSSGTANWDLGDGSPIQTTNAISYVYIDGEPSHFVKIVDFPMSRIVAINAPDDDIIIVDFREMVNLEGFNIGNNSFTLTSIIANGLKLTTALYANSFELLTLILNDNFLTEIFLDQTPKAVTIDVSNNNLDTTQINKALSDLVTNGEEDGTFIWTGNGTATDLDSVNTLLNVRTWVLTGPISTGLSVILDPANMVELQPVLDVSTGFDPNDSKSHNVEDGNSNSFADIYFPVMGGQSIGKEDKGSGLHDLLVFGTEPTFIPNDGPTTSLPSSFDFTRADGDAFTTSGYEGIEIIDGRGEFTFLVHVKAEPGTGLHYIALWGTSFFGEQVSITLFDVTGEVSILMNGLVVAFNDTVNMRDGNWHHVAVRYKGGLGETTEIFIDGNNVGTPGTGATTINIDPDIELRWGSNASGGNSFDGRMTDLRLYPTVLTDEQIVFYANGQTDVWAESTIPRIRDIDFLMHWKLDETSGTTAIDSTGNGNSGTYTNFDATSSVNGRVDTAADMDRLNQDAIIGSALSTDPDGPFSVMWWLRPEDSAGGPAYETGAVSRWGAFNFHLSGFGNSIFVGVDVANDERFTSNDTVDFFDSLDIWIHIAFTIDSDMVMRLYKNGALFAQKQGTTFSKIAWDGLKVGTGNSNDGVDGRFDEFRVYNRLVTTDEISGYVIETGSVLVASLDDNGVTTVIRDTSTNSNQVDGTLIGGDTADLLSRVGKVKRAFQFNGTSDYINFGNNLKQNFTEEITISVLVKIDSWVNDSAGIIVKFGSYSLKRLGNSNRIRFELVGVTDGILDSVADLNTDEWIHIACTFDGNAMKIYLDGVEDNTIVAVGPMSVTSSDLIIGRNGPSGEFYGNLMDDARLYSRAGTADQIEKIYNKIQVEVFGYDSTSETLPDKSPISFVGQDGVGTDNADFVVRNSDGDTTTNSDIDTVIT